MSEEHKECVQDNSLAKAKMKLAAEKASWKDEMWTVAIGAPIIMAFTPGLQKLSADGFQVMKTVPEWYVALAGVCVCYAFYRKPLSLWGLVKNAGGLPK